MQPERVPLIGGPVLSISLGEEYPSPLVPSHSCLDLTIEIEHRKGVFPILLGFRKWGVSSAEDALAHLSEILLDEAPTSTLDLSTWIDEVSETSEEMQYYLYAQEISQQVKQFFDERELDALRETFG